MAECTHCHQETTFGIHGGCHNCGRISHTSGEITLTTKKAFAAGYCDPYAYMVAKNREATEKGILK